MIYKLDKGGIVKLQNAWTTMPSVEDAILRAWSNQSAKEKAKEKAKKQVASEKPKYTYVNPYDYLHGWREATEDAAKQDKYIVENLGGSKEEAEAAYNAAKENAAKQLAGTTATGLGTVALLGLSGGAAGPVAADIVNTGFGAHGLYNALSGNGIQKTVRLANQGDTWGAVKSGAGDLLDLSMGLHAAKLWGDLGKSMLAGQSLGNAYRGNVAGRELLNEVRNFNVSKNPFYSNPTVVSTIDHLYKEHPELAAIGPKEAYSQYYKTIFPASKVQIPYAHGTRGDLSKGLEGSTKVSYTAAPETIGRNDFYLNLQPETSLQYADGIGVPEGFTWNKHRFWPLKEILGKPYKSDSWMFEPIQLRRQIPNRAGQFSRVKNADGTYSGHGKLLEEYKAELGMQDLSDKEFLQKFGIKDGETFEQWVAENKQKFSDIYDSGNYHGLYHVKVDASNPLTINGGNTYYSERGIWDKMNAGKNDILLHNNAANEFGSDVMVVKDVDPSKVRILGSDPDKQAFIDFMNGHNISFTPTPQKPVSTVHFDPRVKPLSRPISEAERLGIIKADRQMYDMFPKIQENAIRFAKEYGYPEPKTLSEIKDMYRRHNTFFRTVSIPSREWNQSIGDDFWKLSKEEQLKILASKGYPREMREYVEEVNPNGPTFQDQFVFVSPTLEENASYFIDGKLDNTVKLQRPFSFNRPSQWHIDADWRPIEQSPQELWPKGKVGIGNTTPEREVKVSTKHLIPIDIAKQSDLGTRNGEYLVERINQASHLPFYDRPNWLKYDGWNWEIDYPSISPRYKQGGTLKVQRGTGLAGIPILKNLAKKGFELVAKRSNGAQTKSIPTIIGDIITGRDKSFYNINNSNGSNEINTYLYGKPYNSEFTGDASIGPDYTNYINKNYPNKNIKTYNTHFGDTLYIDDKAKSLVEKQLNTGEVVGGSMGRYAHAPSYIVTTEEGRPYDAGGHLIKFSKDENGDIVANMSDIYDFLQKDFNDKYDQTKNPSWTRDFANNIGTPFIVRQNKIPVVFKEIVPEYKTEKQKELGDFLSQWGNTYDLKLPLKLSDEQIDEIFDGRDYGDDILDFMISKGYIKPVYKQGGILKTQK